jgi:hypothetical protein
MSWPSTPLLSSGPPFLSEGSGVGRSIQQQILSCNKTRSRTAQKSTGSAKFFRRPKAPRRDLIEDGLLRLFDILSGLLGDGVCGSTEAVSRVVGSRLLIVTLCLITCRANPATKPVSPVLAPFDKPRKAIGAFTALDVIFTTRPNLRSIMLSIVRRINSIGAIMLASSALIHDSRRQSR